VGTSRSCGRKFENPGGGPHGSTCLTPREQQSVNEAIREALERALDADPPDDDRLRQAPEEVVLATLPASPQARRTPHRKPAAAGALR
jgi:hypothetical protein